MFQLWSKEHHHAEIMIWFYKTSESLCGNLVSNMEPRRANLIASYCARLFEMRFPTGSPTLPLEIMNISFTKSKLRHTAWPSPEEKWSPKPANRVFLDSDNSDWLKCFFRTVTLPILVWTWQLAQVEERKCIKCIIHSFFFHARLNEMWYNFLK